MLTVAVMCVLIEARDSVDMIQAQELWKLLLDVYGAHVELLDFAEDRRRIQAAEIVLATWNTYKGKFAGQIPSEPEILSKLSLDLAAHRATLEPVVNDSDLLAPITTLGSTATEEDFSFDLDFQDIDWSFWNSME
jgi:hypothetical protein